MSQLKPFKGLKKDLDSHVKKDGQLLFTVDDNKLYIDHQSVEGKVDRKCINPNADWNAAEGSSSYIKNKPVYLSNVYILEDVLYIEKSDGDYSMYTLVESTEFDYDNGDFVLMGQMCYYNLKAEYNISVMTAKQSIVLDEIPLSLRPKYKTSLMAVTSSTQLSDSILIVFDNSTNQVLAVNRSDDILRDITLLPSSYSFMIKNYAKYMGDESISSLPVTTYEEIESMYDPEFDFDTEVPSEKNSVLAEDIERVFEPNLTSSDFEQMPNSISEDDLRLLFETNGTSSSNDSETVTNNETNGE